MKLRNVLTIIFVIVCTAMAASSALAQTTQTAKVADGQAETVSKPLTKKRLLKLLTLNDSTQQELTQTVTHKGVDFQLAPADERELHDAGASNDLIATVRANYRGEAAQSSTQVNQLQNTSADKNDQAAQNNSNGSAPAPKKKGFFSKLNQGLDKANAKLTKVAATLSPVVPQTGAPRQPAPDTTQTTRTARANPTNAMTDPTTAQVAQTPAGNSSGGSAPASLPGTYWNVMSMTAKGEEEKKSDAPGPDVEFCKNGKWGMLHYGGAREAGTYQIQGDRLIMKMEDGSLFGNFQIKRNGNEMTLDDGRYVLRMRYIHPAGCQ